MPSDSSAEASSSTPSRFRKGSTTDKRKEQVRPSSQPVTKHAVLASPCIGRWIALHSRVQRVAY